MFICPRCKTAASVRRGAPKGRTKVYRNYVCLPVNGGCGLVMTTHETIQRNRQLEAQLTAEQIEWMFGKPAFKYKKVRSPN